MRECGGLGCMDRPRAGHQSTDHTTSDTTLPWRGVGRTQTGRGRGQIAPSAIERKCSSPQVLVPSRPATHLYVPKWRRHHRSWKDTREEHQTTQCPGLQFTGHIFLLLLLSRPAAALLGGHASSTTRKPHLLCTYSSVQPTPHPHHLNPGVYFFLKKLLLRSSIRRATAPEEEADFSSSSNTLPRESCWMPLTTSSTKAKATA